MKINQALQMYPKLKRPEGLFEISNIANSGLHKTERIERPNGGSTLYSATKSLLSQLLEGNIKPPYTITWYEFSGFAGFVGYKCGVHLEETPDKLLAGVFFGNNMIHIADVVFISSGGKLLNDFGFVEVKSLKYIDTPGEEKKEMAHLCNQMAAVVLFTNALLNCKNVRTDSHDFPLRRSIEHYKRIGKPYFEKYYTLKVKAVGSKNQDNPGNNGGWSNAFHVCRGHFKTYTPERPLFGKFTGTYWWESSLRGNSDIGIIEKDYKVLVNQEPAIV
jgi:hypothetical protein